MDIDVDPASGLDHVYVGFDLVYLGSDLFFYA